MAKKSAGILLYRNANTFPEVLLVHPGGPFWAKKDLGAWSIPKGEFEADEEPLEAAIREFKEELGIEVHGDFLELSPRKQKSGKIIYAWGLLLNIDAENIVSNTFELEWPPRTGKMITVPEIDQAAWYSFKEAKFKIIPGQIPILEELEGKIQ